MSTEPTLDLERIYPYVMATSVRDDELLRSLREETVKTKVARMQIAPDQGQFMALLVKLMGARRILEVGTFTGYSSLCMARALPQDGSMLCCDIDEDWTAIARRYWREAGVAHKIELILAPALDTLEERRRRGEEGRYDLAFIDADKENYDAYYEHCLALVRPGGLILLDNTLWSGQVADSSSEAPDTRALQALNRKLKDDERIDLSLLTVADGLTLARKR
ncbi:MAG: class I SAM-dependent methyltransferase [Pseudomonadota bacterium]|nr:class I SAM-dependent methyltransferase [Pseudomonadota bacterium]